MTSYHYSSNLLSLSMDVRLFFYFIFKFPYSKDKMFCNSTYTLVLYTNYIYKMIKIVLKWAFTIILCSAPGCREQKAFDLKIKITRGNDDDDENTSHPAHHNFNIQYRCIQSKPFCGYRDFGTRSIITEEETRSPSSPGHFGSYAIYDYYIVRIYYIQNDPAAGWMMTSRLAVDCACTYYIYTQVIVFGKLEN